MQVLYGTNNPGKLKRLQSIFLGSGIEIVGPKDLGIRIEVEETGTTPLENARLKAQAFYEVADIPTFAVDSGLYLDKLSEEKQPGVFVRRVGGVELDDEEMFVHCELPEIFRLDKNRKYNFSRKAQKLGFFLVFIRTICYT